MNVNQIIDYCIDLDFYPLQNYAGKNFNVVYDHVKNNTTVKPNDLLIPTIFTCIAANGRFSEREWDFVAHFIGNYSYNEAFDMASEFNCQQARDIVKGLVEKLPANVSEALVCMCIAVLCVDKRLDGEEVAFLRTLL